MDEEIYIVYKLKVTNIDKQKWESKDIYKSKRIIKGTDL